MDTKAKRKDVIQARKLVLIFRLMTIKLPLVMVVSFNPTNILLCEEELKISWRCLEEVFSLTTFLLPRRLKNVLRRVPQEVWKTGNCLASFWHNRFVIYMYINQLSGNIELNPFCKPSTMKPSSRLLSLLFLFF